MLRSRPIGPWALVASTTSSRRPPASALPTISSDSPAEYTSAVSTKLIPASSARWMIAIDSSWSGLPHAPNIIAPRHRVLTCIPVVPSVRYLSTPVLQGQTGVRPGHRVQQTEPGRGDVRRARSSPPKQMLVTSTSYCGTGCTATSSPAGRHDVIAPVISVATQTLPSPSTASESSSWKPGKSYSRWSGVAARVGEHAGGGDVPTPTAVRVVVSATYTFVPSGDRPTPFGVISGIDHLGDRRAVGLRVVQPATVRSPGSRFLPRSVNQNPPWASKTMSFGPRRRMPLHSVYRSSTSPVVEVDALDAAADVVVGLLARGEHAVAGRATRSRRCCRRRACRRGRSPRRWGRRRCVARTSSAPSGDDRGDRPASGSPRRRHGRRAGPPGLPGSAVRRSPGSSSRHSLIAGTIEASRVRRRTRRCGIVVTADHRRTTR